MATRKRPRRWHFSERDDHWLGASLTILPAPQRVHVNWEDADGRLNAMELTPEAARRLARQLTDHVATYDRLRVCRVCGQRCIDPDDRFLKPYWHRRTGDPDVCDFCQTPPTKPTTPDETKETPDA